jgi:hypothetical protein
MKHSENLLDIIAKQVHDKEIHKELEGLVTTIGPSAFDEIKKKYGADAKEQIISYLDRDNDGEITDTVPDLVSEVFDWLKDFL